MKKLSIGALLIASTVLASVSCARIEEPQTARNLNDVEDVPYITATLEDDDTRTDFSYSTSTYSLKSTWSVGDTISITPVDNTSYNNLCQIFNYGSYVATKAGATSATFACSRSVTAVGDYYYVFYPGKRVYSAVGFRNFTYTGQIQKKSEPTAHMGKFFSMRQKVVGSYTSVSFAGALKSSCMRFHLSGMTFKGPKEIGMKLINNSGSFYENNYVNESLQFYTSESLNGDKTTTKLSLALEGYSNESVIEAFMMMSCADVVLDSGSTLRTYVIDADNKVWYSDTKITKATTLHGGYCHSLTINSGWTLSSADYTEYSWDGEVTKLQSGKGNLNLVLMGDGFIKEDFDNGTYESIMMQAYNEFFSIEPFTTFKKDFNVYWIKAPSPQRFEATIYLNGAKNSSNETKFSTLFTPNSTTVTGNNNLILEYAAKALKTTEQLKNATIVVMANVPTRAGTCHMTYYPSASTDFAEGFSIAYCALGHTADERVQLMHHEICGHGFGKLGDEYYYAITKFDSSYWTTLASQQKIGLYRNTDKWFSPTMKKLIGWSIDTTRRDEVLWYNMLSTENQYETAEKESLGIFEGGNTMQYGFCRPTYDGSKTIMYGNTGIFNAISRRQIYYRYRHLSGELATSVKSFGDSTELKTFLDWDKTNIMPKIYPIAGTKTAGVNSVLENERPFDPPVLVKGEWVDGKFREL